MLGVVEIVRPMKACYPECPAGSQQCLFKKKCLAQKELFGAKRNVWRMGEMGEWNR